MPSNTKNISRSMKLLKKSQNLIKSMGWKGLGQSIIGTMALTVVLGMADLFNAILGVPMSLLNTLSSIIPALNKATFGGIAGFLGAGFDAGASSFGTGWTALLGIFQAPLGVAVSLLMLWEVAWYLDYTDRDFIGWAMDVPDMLSNNDDSGVAEGEEEE
ncbi:MAG: hypothetical protein ABEI57_01730 [Halapricum sp.]